MIIRDLKELTEIKYALDDIHGYETDNSCSDPDCCGGPYYTIEQFEDAKIVLSRHGIEYVG